MMKLILITSALLSGCVGAAQAQDQNEVVIFPQLAHSAVVTSVRDVYKRQSNFSLADYIGAEVPPLASNLYKHDQTPTVSATGQRFPIAEIK